MDRRLSPARSASRPARRRPLAAAFLALLTLGATLALASTSAGAAPATQVRLAGVAGAITVGQNDFVNVEARDGTGGWDTGYTGTVTFSASCGDCFTVTPNPYTFTPADSGNRTVTLVWTQPGTHSFTVTGTLAGGGTDSDTVSSIVVSGLDAASVRLEGVAGVITAGAADSFNVAARNEQGAPATGYTGTVTFSASCGACVTVTPSSYTYTPADGGVKVFSLTWNQPGTHSFTVTGTLPGGGTDTDTITGITVSGTPPTTTPPTTTPPITTPPTTTPPTTTPPTTTPPTTTPPTTTPPTTTPPGGGNPGPQPCNPPQGLLSGMVWTLALQWDAQTGGAVGMVARYLCSLGF